MRLHCGYNGLERQGRDSLWGIAGEERGVDGSTLQFRLLGPFEVLRGGQPAGPAGLKRRGLLAMLVLRANHTVPAADLIDGLWAADPPPSAGNLVQTYVSAWRKAVEPDRAGRGGGDRLFTAGSGYRLRIEPGELDLDQFTNAVVDGRAVTAAGDPQAGAARLGEALALWRGPPLADLAGLPFQQPAADRLEELRLQAVEAWAAAALECGQARDVLAVVQEARQREPLRERLCELLMWSLFQDGRQAEALAAYEETRGVLADELGADPAAGLRDMHTRVLRHDPRLGPPAASISRRRLPVVSDSFVGRDEELTDVRKLIERHRLVTLTGTGGCGKTRLALEVATEMAAGGGREAFFVDAGPLSDAALIPDRLASAMGIRPAPGQTAADALGPAMTGRVLIVVLDNLEHLPGAAPIVTELLRCGPGLRLLATSRTPLHCRGEYLYPMTPLAVPGQAAELAESAPAVRLFADRAEAADPAFELTAGNFSALAEICRRLDGLPLAIELAASRVRVLPPESLLARLDRRLDLLAGGAGDRPARQQTLRATIDWSYQLLDDPTRRTFRSLAVFRGGWNLPAAAAVCDQADEVILLDELGALIDASLIEPARTVAGQQRFRMLESLREFALEQLTAHGEDEECRNRHADYAYGLAAEAAPYLTGLQQVSYLDRLEADRDNISSALRWLIATAQTARALRTASLLWRFWHLRTHLDEGRALLEELLSRPGSQLEPTVYADGLNALGSVAYWQRDYQSARHSFEEALAICTREDLRNGMAQSHYNLGFTAVFQARDYAAAREYFRQALADYDKLGDRLGSSNALAGLALVDRVAGDYERGRQSATQSLTQQRLLGDEFGATNTLGLLGSITSRTGAVAEAEGLLREALTLHERAGNISGILWMLRELAATAAAQGQPEKALMLSGAARSLEGELGGGIGIELELAQLAHAAWEQLDPAQAQHAWDSGQAMSRRQAIKAALAADA